MVVGRALGTAFAVLVLGCGGESSVGDTPGGSAGLAGGGAEGRDAGQGGGGAGGRSGGSGGSPGGTAGAGGQSGSGGAGSGGSAGAGGSSAGTGGGAGVGACSSFMGAATAEEVALTPRADSELELLALRATTRAVAPSDAYSRVGIDVRAIREGYVEVASIRARPLVDPSSLTVSFDDEGIVAVRAGTYDAWACPNMQYGASFTVTTLSNFVTLSFPGLYRTSLVAADYASLEHVAQVSPNGTVGDGDNICVRAHGDTYEYLFVHGQGDCEAGCITREYWGFSAPFPGDIMRRGSSRDGDLPSDWNDGSFSCGTE